MGFNFSQIVRRILSGLYYEPSVGWYYNSHDGLYYKLEDGQFLPWNSDERNDEYLQPSVTEIENTSLGDSGLVEQGSSEVSLISEGDPPPQSTSDWLEETLIDLYLSGYSNNQENVGCSSTFEKDGDLGQMEEERESCDKVSEEENWLAQYGQVVKSDDMAALTLPLTDLWEWKLVQEKSKKRDKVMRLVGRLIKRTAKLHPSVSAGPGFLKTAPISKVNLDLVQVETGKIYRLRSPSPDYLSSLLTYDSSDPTKDWCFPRLELEMLSSLSDPTIPSNTICLKSSRASSLNDKSVFVKIHTQKYRDRAAERRALHGINGIGIGQRDSFDEAVARSSPVEEFETNLLGNQRYGRMVLERMGWKEGEGIGNTKKGMLQPLQVAGNKGTAGLGWSNERGLSSDVYLPSVKKQK
ncbi:D111/G-patch domain-containing protein isoform X2 [Wolffia australiana]